MRSRLGAWLPMPSATLVVLLLAGALLAGCGGGDSSSTGTNTSSGATDASSGQPSSNSTEDTEGPEGPDVSGVSEKELEKTIELAFNKAIPAAELPELAVEGLKVASLPITPELEEQLLKCMEEPDCETGHGDKTIGIAEDLSSEDPYRIIQRAVITLQSLRYPSVSRIIYTEAGGELPKLLSNFRSLTSQGADVITGNWGEGDALIPVAREATAKGVAVIPSNQSIPSAVQGTDVAGEVESDLCSVAEERAAIAIKAAGGGTGTAQLMTGVPGNAYAAVWQPCAEKVLKAEGWQVQKSNTDWTPQGEQQAASALVASSNPPDAIIYDYTGEPIIDQYLKEGKEPPPLLTTAGSIGYLTAAKEAEKKFPEFETFTDTSLLAYWPITVTTGLAAAEGKSIPETMILPDPTESIDAPQIEAQYDPELPASVSLNSLLPSTLLEKLMGE